MSYPSSTIMLQSKLNVTTINHSWSHEQYIQYVVLICLFIYLLHICIMVITIAQVICPDSGCIRCGPQTMTIYEDEPES